ncbi:unnamed protein product [Leptosia nina]|uniref:Uncharacterized protein n=1 Tax=Leptosia nina TaxID=320188 RepID=A0AAV1JRK5_9NEOP
MNCLTPKSRRRKEERDIPPYYTVQPPYNPEYMYENFESKTSFYFPGGIRYTVHHTLDREEDVDGRGVRRSLYEGVNQPVSARVLLVCIARRATHMRLRIVVCFLLSIVCKL